MRDRYNLNQLNGSEHELPEFGMYIFNTWNKKNRPLEWTFYAYKAIYGQNCRLYRSPAVNGQFITLPI